MTAKQTMRRHSSCILLISLFLVGTVLAQPVSEFKERSFPFKQVLTKVTDKDSVTRFNEVIALRFKPGSTEMDVNPLIDPFAKWRLLYYRTTDNTTYYDGKHFGHDDRYKHKTATALYTTTAILDTFDIDQNVQPLNQIPLVFARDAKYNGEWTVILPDPESMIIRYVHSYPDGNAQSWYREQIYYFKKAD